MSKIHPTAIIDPGAKLGENLIVGPYAVIEDNVSIGDNCIISGHAVIKQHSRLGRSNIIHEHAVIGGTPQDLSFSGYVSFVDIGDENVLREYVTIHRGSKENSSTVLGNNNYLMAYSHVAHDCVLQNSIITANNAQIAGHVEIGDRAFIAGQAGIHQFCRVGSLAMVGANSKIIKDCLPFITSDGNPARARGLNIVGLKRAGISSDEIKLLKQAYRLLLRSELRLDDALKQLATIDSTRIRELVRFIELSKRGFVHSK